MCGACLSSCVAQTITIDLTQKSDHVCRPGWTIGPASGAPAFTDQLTDEQVFAINLKLAKLGNTEAAFSLGQAYVEGVGVLRDPKQAIHWFEIGATTPDEKAFVAHLFTYDGCFEKDLMLLRVGTPQLDGPEIFLSWLKAIVWPLHRKRRRLYQSTYLY